jgi:DNA-binding NtrC family response regulator
MRHMEMVHFIPPIERRMAMQAALSDQLPALILGSSGTGKGAIAKWIHRNSPRALKPFVTARLETPLYEQLPLAREGTLLVPEITEFPLGEQLRLLEFLKNKTIPHPHSSSLRMLVPCRVIATSSHGIEKRAEAGLFNAELLAELSAFRIEMPDLALRSEEFEDIALGIFSEITHELGKDYLRTISAETLVQLLDYHWPGNLRELRNVLRIAVLTATGERIEARDLPDFKRERVDFRASRDQFERVYFTELMRNAGGDLKRAAESTRMEPETLRARLQALQIQV